MLLLKQVIGFLKRKMLLGSNLFYEKVFYKLNIK